MVARRAHACRLLAADCVLTALLFPTAVLDQCAAQFDTTALDIVVTWQRDGGATVTTLGNRPITTRSVVAAKHIAPARPTS
jgi:hypothetical protein